MAQRLRAGVLGTDCDWPTQFTEKKLLNKGEESLSSFTALKNIIPFTNVTE